MRSLINMKQVEDTIDQLTKMSENEGIQIDVSFIVSRVTLYDLAKKHNEEVKDCSGSFVNEDVRSVYLNPNSNLGISFWNYEQNKDTNG